MNDMLILAHPDNNSFQYSLMETIRNSLASMGHSPRVFDLYKEQFPPMLPQEEIRRGISCDPLVLQHQKFLAQAKRLFIFYPDWWGQPPAVLKGWIDRVLAQDVAYRWEGDDFLEKTWVPLLKGKDIFLYISSDNSLDLNFLYNMWQDHVFGPCGATVHIQIIDNIRNKSYRQIQEWVKEQVGKF